MKYLIVTVLVLAVPAFGRPQEPQAQSHLLPQAQGHQQPQAQSSTTPVTIISQTEVVGVDGTFNFSYETSNGIKVSEDGYVKKGAEQKSLDPAHPDETGDIQVIQGSYSYTAPDGQEIHLTYLADDNGFQPQGAHLPVAPAVPEGLARSLEHQQPQQQPLAQTQQTHQTYQPTLTTHQAQTAQTVQTAETHPQQATSQSPQ